MLVCLCHAVTGAAVTVAVETGAHDLAELGRRTGAGTDCGQCRPVLEELLAQFDPDRRE